MALWKCAIITHRVKAILWIVLRGPGDDCLAIDIPGPFVFTVFTENADNDNHSGNTIHIKLPQIPCHHKTVNKLPQLFQADFHMNGSCLLYDLFMLQAKPADTSCFFVSFCSPSK